MSKTVGELINELKTLPQETEVEISSTYFDGYLPIWGVKYHEESGSVLLEVEERDLYEEEDDAVEVDNSLNEQSNDSDIFKE